MEMDKQTAEKDTSKTQEVNGSKPLLRAMDFLPKD
jgi:ubiquinone/menaquinone biosynthesis C-methylase UbiE